MFPETYETINFNNNGECNICSSNLVQKETIDWKTRKKELKKIIEKYRNKSDYDCIVPYSGGKDSTFQLYYLMKEFKLKPLVIRFNHGFYRNQIQDNTTTVLKKLGADFLEFTPNWKVVKNLMLESFKRKGDFCWHCHTGIFSYPMWVAIEKKIPLIFWGEKSSEYSNYYGADEEEEVDEKRFDRFINLGITSKDMYLRIDEEFGIKKLKPYTYPPKKELTAINLRSVCLGTYIKWDVPKQSKIIMDELGWKGDEVENVPEQYNYEKIECYMQGVRDYIKYIKRGYSRPSHLVALDLRNKKITKEKAKELVSLYEGKKPQSLNLFLDFIGLTEEQFYEVAIGHEISPHKFQRNANNSKKTDDFDSWSKDGGANKEETLKIFEKWKKEKEFFKN